MVPLPRRHLANRGAGHHADRLSSTNAGANNHSTDGHTDDDYAFSDGRTDRQ
jgi:hypothetical protein